MKEETEVKSKQELIEEWESAIEAAEFYGKGKEDRLIEYMRDFVDDLNQLDERDQLEIAYKDILSRREFLFDDKRYVVVEKPTVPQIVAEWHESEETEVKKDLEWLLDYVEAEYDKAEEKEEDHPLDLYYTGKREALREVFGKINQLDEPEVLSDKWIDDNSVYASSDGITEEYVHVDDLKELLVPRQEEVEEGRVRLIVGFDGGTESYSLNSVDEAFETLTDYGSKYEVVPKQEEHSSETDSVEEVVADFGRALERLRELWRNLEVEELEE